ncbi:hypothetical protein [Rhodococcus xishaensis]|uniref:hypothetical protein n=1 Tax=Rhodococcus xishaensis TaxID=2487364 RepID=UPI0019D4D6A6|nr:hypothetical protein [Rhodococcus xishaensis]
MKLQRIRRFQQAAQLVTVIVLAVNVVLLVGGTITARQAMWLFVAVEVPLVCAVTLMLGIAIVAQLRRGDRLRDAAAGALGHSPLRPLVRAEIRAYRALWLWISGRHSGIQPGAIMLTASHGTLALPTAFAVATVIEIVVLHLVLPWMWLRVSLAVVSVWSLVALFGFLAVHRTNPHYLTDTSLVLRQSGAIVADVELANIESLALRPRFTKTAPAITSGRLFLPNADGTTLDLALKSPVSAQLPALIPSRRKAEEINHISVYLDDPSRLFAVSNGHDRPRSTLEPPSLTNHVRSAASATRRRRPVEN